MEGVASTFQLKLPLLRGIGRTNRTVIVGDKQSTIRQTIKKDKKAEMKEHPVMGINQQTRRESVEEKKESEKGKNEARNAPVVSRTSVVQADRALRPCDQDCVHCDLPAASPPLRTAGPVRSPPV